MPTGGGETGTCVTPPFFGLVGAAGTVALAGTAGDVALAGAAGTLVFASGGPAGNGISSNIDGVPPVAANVAARGKGRQTGLSSTSIVSAVCLGRFRTGLAIGMVSRHLSQLHLCATMQQSLLGP